MPPGSCRPPTTRDTGRPRLRLTLALLLAVGWLPVRPAEDWDGRQIMDAAFRRHELFPYTYEEQTLVLMDAAGNRDSRKLRSFTRIEADGTLKFLLAFVYPPEVRGTALLAVRHPSGRIDTGVYLPAFGPVLTHGSGDNRGSHFLGTDFALEDLSAEVMSDFRYQRRDDAKIAGIPYFVVDAYPSDRDIERETGYGRKRHFVRRDILLLTRTDYFDRKDQLFKRLTRHDLKQLDARRWRADMVLMEDFRERHKTLIKVDKRVFSRDYVPAGLFSFDGLLAGLHITDPRRRLLQTTAGESAGAPAQDARRPDADGQHPTRPPTPDRLDD